MIITMTKHIWPSKYESLTKELYLCLGQMHPQIDHIFANLAS